MKTVMKLLAVAIILMCALLLIVYPIVGIIGITFGVFLFVYSGKMKSKAEKEAIESARIQKEIEERHAKKQEELRAQLENPIFIDTETTGLKPYGNDEILALAIVDKKGTVLFDQLIKPEKRKSWPSAEEINHISPAMVKNCDHITDHLDEIQGILNTATAVIGYNVEFDANFLDAAGLIIKAPSIDVMEEYSRYKVEDPDRRFKLTTAAKHFGYKWPDGDAHTALADAQATRFVYEQILKAKGIDL